jgi:hypothetical protein
MNAYELAEIITVHDSSRVWEHGLEIATMLRQQADRIAELEKDGKVCATCGGLVYDAVIKQTKPISDEEMLEICQRIGVDYGSWYIHEFARAIEERHGIK